MKMSRCVWMSLAIVALTSGLRAQEVNRIPITLQEAIEIGLSENPTVLIADQEILRTEYVRREAAGNLLPNISGNGNFTHNIQKQKMYMGDGFNIAAMMGDALYPLFANIPESMQPDWSSLGGSSEEGGKSAPIEVGLRNSMTGGFSLTMPLFMPTIYKNLQLTQIQILNAVEQARQNKITLANQIKKNYYGILLAESSLDVINQNIAYAQTVVDDTKNQFDQGIVSEYDLITAEVQLSNLFPTRYQTENSIKVSRLMMNMLLSLPLDTYLDMQEDLYDFKSVITDYYDGSVDLTDNSDLRLLDIQGDLLQKQLELQRAARMPTLSGFLNYSVTSQNEKLNIAHYQWLGYSTAGLQLNVPIFAGFTNKNKEKQIKVNMRQLNLQRDYTEQSLNVEAQTALSNVDNARKQMIANEATKQQAQKGYNISKTRYDVGAGTIVELNSAQMALLQADLNYSQSIYDYVSAQADYDRILGKEN